MYSRDKHAPLRDQGPVRSKRLSTLWPDRNVLRLSNAPFLADLHPVPAITAGRLATPPPPPSPPPADLFAAWWPR